MDAQGSVETINKETHRLTGWTDDEIKGRPVSEALPLLDNETRRPLSEALRDAAREGAALVGGSPVALLHRDGTETAVTARAAPVRDEQGQAIGQLVTLQSGGGLVQASGAGAISGITDSLTGLLNTRGFEQALQATLSVPALENRHHFLCIVDLDHFHQVNEQAGRFAADDLLRRLGRVIRETLRAVDPVGRLAADRYAILLENCTLDKAEFLAEKLRSEVEDFRLVWQELTVHTTACVSVVPMSAAAPLAVDWIRAAESSCYAAKEQGGNQVRWDKHWATRLSRQYEDRQWATRVDLALKSDEFELYVQPSRALKPGRPAYNELLLRLHDSDGKPIPAGRFLPIAERAGHGIAIDQWVVDAVISAWQTGKLPGNDSLWGINLSAAPLDVADFSTRLGEQLRAANMPGERLSFEVKGSKLAQDLGKARRLFDARRDLGCRVALDNVGARASTFACLKELKVDLVKLDGSLVSAMSGDAMSATLVEAVQKAATVQGIPTIAKWVENPETLKRVTQLGGAYAQGHGIEPVQPLSSFVEGSQNGDGTAPATT
jgi:diguanylate cyclase (GGDEF)-like protein/PAS domain S-box-containing protein